MFFNLCPHCHIQGSLNNFYARLIGEPLTICWWTLRPELPMNICHLLSTWCRVDLTVLWSLQLLKKYPYLMSAKKLIFAKKLKSPSLAWLKTWAGTFLRFSMYILHKIKLCIALITDILSIKVRVSQLYWRKSHFPKLYGRSKKDGRRYASAFSRSNSSRPALGSVLWWRKEFLRAFPGSGTISCLHECC